MKIKTPTEFQVFNGGYCQIHRLRGNQLAECLGTLPFSRRGIGYKRMYAAAAAAQRLSLLICVPMQSWIAQGQRVVIEGSGYSIEGIQPMPDSCPPSSQLSLSKVGGRNG